MDMTLVARCFWRWALYRHTHNCCQVVSSKVNWYYMVLPLPVLLRRTMMIGLVLELLDFGHTSNITKAKFGPERLVLKLEAWGAGTARGQPE